MVITLSSYVVVIRIFAHASAPPPSSPLGGIKTENTDDAYRKGKGSTAEQSAAVIVIFCENHVAVKHSISWVTGIIVVEIRNTPQDQIIKLSCHCT
nr:hypothetical protein [Citrobacter freundii]